jgi:ribosome-binding protein aMBF1 (putative translation factor)
MSNETTQTTETEISVPESNAVQVQELISTANGDPAGSVTVTPSRKPRSKETKPRIRLSEDQAQEIKRLYESGNASQKDLAKQFNVTQGAISHIVTGKRWSRLKANSTPAADA